MNTFNFPYYIRSNNALNEFTLKQLSQLIRNYPYFQMARMLYLKNLYVLHKEEFESELKRNVLYITDRKKLYELLFEQSFPTSEADNAKNSNNDNGGSSTEAIHTTGTKESIATMEDISPNGSDTEAQDEPPRLSNAVKRIFTESMRENISGLLDFQRNEADKVALEEELRLNTIQYDVEKEYGDQLEVIDHNLPSIEFDLEQENNNEELQEADLVRISNSVSSARGLLNREYRLKKNETSEEIKTEELEEPEIETELLELDAAKVTTPDEDLEQIQADPNLEEESGKSFTEWLDEINHQNKEEQPSYQLENKAEIPLADDEKPQNNLIDRFIQLNPTIRPTVKLEHEQYDISTESIEESEDYLTDTLAKIYVRQERYHKAISVYKKLILKYPEKNTYFANQINEIEKKLNN